MNQSRVMQMDMYMMRGMSMMCSMTLRGKN